MRIINISRDFSPLPAGRHHADGPYSAQRFRDDILLPALLTGEEVQIDFSGIDGIASSFLEEVFAGLYREYPREARLVAGNLSFVPAFSAYTIEALDYLEKGESALRLDCAH